MLISPVFASDFSCHFSDEGFFETCKTYKIQNDSTLEVISKECSYLYEGIWSNSSCYKESFSGACFYLDAVNGLSEVIYYEGPEVSQEYLNMAQSYCNSSKGTWQ